MVIFFLSIKPNVVGWNSFQERQIVQIPMPNVSFFEKHNDILANSNNILIFSFLQNLIWEKSKLILDQISISICSISIFGVLIGF